MLEICLLMAICMQLSFPVLPQTDSNPPGFIGIDCGLSGHSSIRDDDHRFSTNLTYLSDDQFIDTGENYQIYTWYEDGLENLELSVRSFPNGTRNCYNLKPLTVGFKYLVQAGFFYGNYDKLDNPPTFDIYLGINYWDTVTSTDSDNGYYPEIIYSAMADNIHVCLVSKGLGTPFISSLQLNQLDMSMYSNVTSTQSLVYVAREYLGSNSTSYIRYPNDYYDRIWWNFNTTTWNKSTNHSTVGSPDPEFRTPSLILQTAAITSSTNEHLVFSWSSSNISTEFYVVLHIAETEDVPSTDLREFDILCNGHTWFKAVSPGPSYIQIDGTNVTTNWLIFSPAGYTNYTVSVQATARSTLPPLLNAYEVYKYFNLTGIPTDVGDVTAINTIKEKYNVKKGWSGDPCVPAEFAWISLNCSAVDSNIPRITNLNLSSSGLTGAVISSFGNLTALVSLDLSNNNLSGHLPDFLDQLSALIYLDITGNNDLSTTLPSALQTKYQNRILRYKFDPKNKKSSIPIIAGAGVVVLLLIIIVISTIIYFQRCRKNQISIPKPVESYGSTPLTNHYAGHFASSLGINSSYTSNTGQDYDNNSKRNGVEGMWSFEYRQFSYNDIMKITNNFQNNIGTGGFGSVYVGILENGTQVAVKIRSHSSSQGVKEFLAEAQNLTRVHHINLVLLLGYCLDKGCMALVYEYMQEGTLQDKLKDNGRPLTWKQRLQIAYESAQGLEYLHKACNPPLIHRDVKTNNILLNANLVAKIADFGLSRAFNSASTHVSTAVVGTPGYLDPEYYSSYQLSEKSDVFSFGVVLLEIITGNPPIIPGPHGGHVTKWVSQKLSRGDIESVVDPRLQEQYDINSVWKVTELALKCTEINSAQRPTMSGVVSELKESLDLEISTEGTRTSDITCTSTQNAKRNDNYATDVSQNSMFEMAYIEGLPSPVPAER